MAARSIGRTTSELTHAMVWTEMLPYLAVRLDGAVPMVMATQHKLNFASQLPYSTPRAPWATGAPTPDSTQSTDR